MNYIRCISLVLLLIFQIPHSASSFTSFPSAQWQKCKELGEKNKGAIAWAILAGVGIAAITTIGGAKYRYMTSQKLSSLEIYKICLKSFQMVEEKFGSEEFSDKAVLLDGERAYRANKTHMSISELEINTTLLQYAQEKLKKEETYENVHLALDIETLIRKHKALIGKINKKFSNCIAHPVRALLRSIYNSIIVGKIV